MSDHFEVNEVSEAITSITSITSKKKRGNVVNFKQVELAKLE